MARKLPDLIRRQRALAKTLAKYRDKPIDWRRFDCVRMLRSHLVWMGHRCLPKVPKYASPHGAKRALKHAGHDGIEALLDSLLPRIAPAQALPGDIVLVAGGEGFDAIEIWLGQHAFGWHNDHPGATVLDLHEMKGAWRA